MLLAMCGICRLMDGAEGGICILKSTLGRGLTGAKAGLILVSMDEGEALTDEAKGGTMFYIFNIDLQEFVEEFSPFETLEEALEAMVFAEGSEDFTILSDADIDELGL